MAKIKITNDSPLVPLATIVLNPSSEEDEKIEKVLQESAKIDNRLARYKQKCAQALEKVGYSAALLSNSDISKFKDNTLIYEYAKLYQNVVKAEKLLTAARSGTLSPLDNSQLIEHVLDVGRRIGKLETRIPLRGEKEVHTIRGIKVQQGGKKGARISHNDKKSRNSIYIKEAKELHAEGKSCNSIANTIIKRHKNNRPPSNSQMRKIIGPFISGDNNSTPKK